MFLSKHDAVSNEWQRKSREARTHALMLLFLIFFSCENRALIYCRPGRSAAAVCLPIMRVQRSGAKARQSQATPGNGTRARQRQQRHGQRHGQRRQLQRPPSRRQRANFPRGGCVTRCVTGCVRIWHRCHRCVTCVAQTCHRRVTEVKTPVRHRGDTPVTHL